MADTQQPAPGPHDGAGPADWLRLALTPGVGPETGRRLLAAFGLPGKVFDAGVAALMKVVPERVALALAAAPAPEIAERIETTLAWLAQPGNHLLTLADAEYPRALLDIPDPPLMLYAKGRVDLLNRPSLAVVGSRNATAQGIANAERFAEAFSAAGLTVVSGLALGIDAAAHQGALRHAGGSTVAVIGTGCDIVYPARNRGLAHRIADGGCIVSEYALGVPAIAANFPRRNRLISGLARGVLVVEAAAQSGSLITARTAADQGRDVFAIPGSIHSPLAKGCHQLIRQGAKLVESAEHVLEELRLPAANEATDFAAGVAPGPAAGNASPSDPGHPLLRALGHDPASIDMLAVRTGMDAAQLHAELLTLELDGRIERLPGDRYRRLD